MPKLILTIACVLAAVTLVVGYAVLLTRAAQGHESDRLRKWKGTVASARCAHTAANGASRAAPHTTYRITALIV